MIIVSISSTEEKFVIKLKHKINYVVEKNYRRITSLNKRAICVIVQLFFSTLNLIYKEIFLRSHE